MANVRLKNIQFPGLDNTYTIPDEAPAYSTSGTYAVGDMVIYDGKLYKCTTAITTAEAWTAAHWSETKMGNEVSELKTAFTQRSAIYKNVFDTSKITANGTTWTETDGVYYGKVASLSAVYNANNLYPLDYSFKSNTVYTVSFEGYTTAVGGADNNGFQIVIKYTDNTTTNISLKNNNTTWTSISKASTEGKTVAGVTFGYGNAGSNYWYIRKIQVEEGNTATAFVPYMIPKDNYARDSIDEINNRLSVDEPLLSKTATTVDNSLETTVTGSGTISIKYNFIKDHLYTIVSNVVASLNTSNNGSTVLENIGNSIPANAPVDFTPTQDAAYLLIWSSSSSRTVNIVDHGDVKNVVDSVSEKLNALASNNIGYGSVLFDMARGYYTSSSATLNAVYRARSKTGILAEANLIISTSDDYVLNAFVDDGENVYTQSDTRTFKVPKGSTFYLNFKKANEVTSEWIDLEVAKNAISIKTEEYENIPLNKAFFALQKPHFALHRGYKDTGIPENSTASFENAGVHGAWGCETDIRETSDGYFVCMHDATVNRTTDGTGYVRDMTLAQLRALHLESTNYTIPTIQEFLQICKVYGMIPFIEIKQVENGGVSVSKIMQIIQEFGLINNCVITASTYIQVLFRREYRSVPCIINVDTTTPERYATIVDDIKHYENMIIAFEHSDTYLTDEIIQNAHKNNIGVCVWVIDGDSETKKWFGKGADMITTNYTTEYST